MNEPEQQETFVDYIARHDLKLVAQLCPAGFTPPGSDPKWEAFHYVCVILNGKRSFSTFFSMGKGHVFDKGPRKGQPQPPTLADILNSLASDAQGIEVYDFTSWCGDTGYDSDSIKARRIFDACCQVRTDLILLLDYAGYNELCKCERL